MTYFTNNLDQKIAYKFFKGKSPGIIYIHGLTSDMEGKKAQSIEKYAKKRKISFLKFDCRGHGKSFGKFENFTISDWKKDLLDIIDNIAKGPQILIGSSMGGWLMLLAAKSRKSRIAGLIGLAPAADFTKYLFNEIPKKNRIEINKKGISKVKLWNYNYTFTKNLFKDGNKNLVLKKKLSLNKPIILIHGLLDEPVSPKISEKISTKISSKKVEIRFLKNSNHELSNNYELKVINNAIDNLLKII